MSAGQRLQRALEEVKRDPTNPELRRRLDIELQRTPMRREQAPGLWTHPRSPAVELHTLGAISTLGMLKRCGLGDLWELFQYEGEKGSDEGQEA